MADYKQLQSESGHFAKPVLITVAPNGARLTKNDHPRLPVNPGEVAKCALACQRAGAAMLHMHARDKDGKHSLDVDVNQRYLDVVRDQVGKEMVIQLTTESVGQYSPEEQMALVRRCRPEAASIAIRELIPDEDSKPVARDFFTELAETGTIYQLIIYSVEDLQRYYQLLEEQVIRSARHHLLFVIGRHLKASESAFVTFLSQLKSDVAWSVCAFGRLEHRLTSAAIALNGDVRIGFENNLADSVGAVAEDNAQLVRQSAKVAGILGRPLFTAAQFRSMMSTMSL